MGDLEYTHIRDSEGEFVEVRPGDQVAFINPNVLSGQAKRLQHKMIKTTEQLLGSGPYKVQGIEMYDNKNIVFQVEGKGAKTKLLNLAYLVKLA